MSTLTVRDLAVRLGTREVLRGVDLTVPEGSVTAVVGPSGCGKTTLLRAVAGFVPVTAGTITAGATTLVGPQTHLAPERRGVALVPQEGALFPHLDVAGNVAFGLAREHRKSALGAARVAEVLELVGLGGAQTRRPAELSGGQQQRVALARALAPKPAVVLLDEPFSALDASLREAVRDQVREALERAGATAVVVTHDQDEALSIADRVAVLDDGRILMEGTPEEVYFSPAQLRVARFIGQVVELPATLREGVASTELGDLRVEDPAGGGSAVTGAHRPVDGVLVLRPEQLRLGAFDATTGTRGAVIDTSFYGHDATVRVRLDSGLEVLVRTLGTLPRVGEVTVTVEGAGRFYPASEAEAR